MQRVVVPYILIFSTLFPCVWYVLVVRDPLACEISKVELIQQNSYLFIMGVTRGM